MAEGARKRLLKDICEDLAGKSEAQIAYACKLWRSGDHPRRFPTSGELLELMKNPFDTPRGRSYDHIPEIKGPFISPERAAEVLRKAGFKSVRDERSEPEG